MPARHDLATDPAVLADLLFARRGQAYYSRKLKELSNADLYRPALDPSWSRAHVVAHVGFTTRSRARAAEAVLTGHPIELEDEVGTYETVEYGATLTPIALRNLAQHAAIHLNVAWRDLPPDAWTATVEDQGENHLIADTLRSHAEMLWLAAIELNNGARFSDLPARVKDRYEEVKHSMRLSSRVTI